MGLDNHATEHRQRLLEEPNIELARDDDQHASPTAVRSPGSSTTRRVSPWFLAISLLVTSAGFVVQTEANVYYADVLGWIKPCSSFYVANSALILPWVAQIIFLRMKHHNIPYKTWANDYMDQLTYSISTIDSLSAVQTPAILRRLGFDRGPLASFLVAMFLTFLALTVSASWFWAIIWTTPGDSTAIFNCSAFFAAAFSVPLLKQRIGWASIFAVLLSVVGTFIIAYGNSGVTDEHMGTNSGSPVGSSRLLGNLFALFGAIGFGLYEVLFKKWACSPKLRDATSSLTLTLAATALHGFYTLLFGWIVVLGFHILDIERFELPGLEASVYLAISVITGSGTRTHLLQRLGYGHDIRNIHLAAARRTIC